VQLTIRLLIAGSSIRGGVSNSTVGASGLANGTVMAAAGLRRSRRELRSFVRVII